MQNSRGLLAITLTGVLSLSLAACATRSDNIPTPPVVEIPTPTLPPKELLEDCKDVDYTIETNEDLAQAFNTRGDMLRLCSADKEALRAWADELQEDE